MIIKNRLIRNESGTFFEVVCKKKEKEKNRGNLPLGTVDNILVDAVGDGPVTGGGRD